MFLRGNFPHYYTKTKQATQRRSLVKLQSFRVSTFDKDIFLSMAEIRILCFSFLTRFKHFPLVFQDQTSQDPSAINMFITGTPS